MKISVNKNILIICAAVFLAQVVLILLELRTTAYVHDEVNNLEFALRLFKGRAPTQYLHGTVIMFLLSAVSAVYFLFGRLFGFFIGTESFAIHYMTSPQYLYLFSKAAVSCVYLLVIWLTYKTAEKFWDRKAAFYSALFSATAFLPVFHSTLLKEDTAAALFVLAAGYFFFKHACSGAKRHILKAGFLCGIAVAAKPTALPVLLCLPVFYAVSNSDILRLKNIPRHLFTVSASFAMAAAGFLLLNPFLIFDFPAFAGCLARISSEHLVFMQNDFICFWKTLIPLALGMPLAVIAYIFLIYGFIKGSRRALWLAVFPLIFALVFHKKSGAVYHMIPALPFFFISAGVFFSKINKGNARSKVLLILLLAVALAQPAIRFVKIFRVLSGPDTRIESLKWIEANVPAGKKIYLEGSAREFTMFAPQLAPNEATLKNDIARVVSSGGSGYALSLAQKYNIYKNRKTYNIKRGEIDTISAQEILNFNPDYAVLSGVNDENLQYILLTDNSQRLNRRALQLDTIKKHYKETVSYEPYPVFTRFFPLFTTEDFRGLDNMSLFWPASPATGPQIKILTKNK